jgi:hypothetical protein
MEFIKIIKSVRAGLQDILVCYDVLSLLTVVVTGEVLRLLIRHFYDDVLQLLPLYKHLPFQVSRAVVRADRQRGYGFAIFNLQDTAEEGEIHKPLWWCP